LNPEEDHLYELGGCHCGGTGEEGKEKILKDGLTLEEDGVCGETAHRSF